MTGTAEATLRPLYEAAIAFKELAPWRWMGNDDVFAIAPGSAQEPLFCSVMGDADEEFGLAAFVGNDGAATMQRLMSGELDPGSLDIITRMRSLSLTLEDRADIEKRDYETIKSLGLKFRGRKAWPMFRSQQPGYWPWHLEPDEAELFLPALQQSLVVAEQVKAENIDLLGLVDDGRILTRRQAAEGWTTTVEDLPPLPELDFARLPDVASLRALAAERGYGKHGWEVDLFVVPARIQETRDSRPYPPCCILIVDDEGFIVDARLIGPDPSIDDCQDTFITILEGAPSIPREIRISRQDPARMVLAVTQVLDIPVDITETPLLDEARRSLLEQAL